MVGDISFLRLIPSTELLDCHPSAICAPAIVGIAKRTTIAMRLRKTAVLTAAPFGDVSAGPLPTSSLSPCPAAVALLSCETRSRRAPGHRRRH
jgi:hypothetical protein